MVLVVFVTTPVTIKRNGLVVRLLNSNYNSDMTKVVSIVITKQHPSLSSTLHLHPCDQSQVIK